MVAALLWTVLRFGFTWYATSVANYESAFGPLSTGITLLVFLYFASVIVLLGAEFARASALEDEIGSIAAADPRFLPVPTGPAAGFAGARTEEGHLALDRARRRRPHRRSWAGRLSKRDDDGLRLARPRQV